jgi:hypothetical protein
VEPIPGEEESMTPKFDLTARPIIEALYGRIHELEANGAPLAEVEAVEKALDMAIERGAPTKRKEEALGDVLRNGRFSARRSRAREARLVQRFLRMEPRFVTGRRRYQGDFVAPDSTVASVEARQLVEILRTEAAACGRHGPEVLSSLIAGESVAEAAASARVSRATANRTIKRIREATRLATG